MDENTKETGDYKCPGCGSKEFYVIEFIVYSGTSEEMDGKICYSNTTDNGIDKLLCRECDKDLTGDHSAVDRLEYCG